MCWVLLAGITLYMSGLSSLVGNTGISSRGVGSDKVGLIIMICYSSPVSSVFIDFKE